MSDNIAKVFSEDSERTKRQQVQLATREILLVPKVIQGGTGVNGCWGIAALESVQGFPGSLILSTLILLI